MPSSHGKPADLMPVHEEAPVPPSCPETVICSALPCYKKSKTKQKQLYQLYF